MSFADFLAQAAAGDGGLKPLRGEQKRTVYTKRARRERKWPYTDQEDYRPYGRPRRVKEF